MDIAELVIKIDSSQPELAAKVLDKLSSSSQKTGDSVAALEKTFQKLVAIIGPAVLLETLRRNIMHAIELQESYVRLSEIAGTTAQMMGAMDLPARLAGTSLEAVAASVAKLGKSIGEARLGDVQKSGLLSALGIDANDGRDAAEVMVDVSRALIGMKDQTVAGAASMTLLGRGFAEMRPFMREVVEQGGLVARTTEDEARKAKEFQDALTKLKYEFQLGATALSQTLLPTLLELVRVFRAMQGEIKDGSSMLSDSLSFALRGTAAVALGTVEAFYSLGRTVGAIAAAIGMYANKDYRGAANVIKELDNDLEKHAVTTKARIEAIWASAGKAEGGKMPPAVKEASGGTSEAERRVREMMEFNKHYEARVAAAKGFAETYSDAIKTGNVLAAEARKQELISEATFIQQLGANKAAELQVQLQSLEEQKKLHERKGELGKAQEATNQIKQANAAIIANDAITQARLTSAREIADLEFKRGIAEKAAAQTMELQDERGRLEAWLAEQNNINEIYRNIGLQDEVEFGARQAEIYARYEEERTRITDEEAKKRYGINEVYRKADMNSTRAFLGYMEGLMNSKSRAMFEVGKAAAIAGAVIDTYKAATGAYAAMANIPYIGPALGAAAAAAAIVAGMANVQQIKSQKFGGGGSATPTVPSSPTTGIPAGQPGGSGPNFGLENVATTARSSTTTTVHLHGETYSRSQVRDFLEHLNENSVDGGRVVVLEG